MKPRSPFTLVNKPIIKTLSVKPFRRTSPLTKLKLLRLAIQAYMQMDIKKLWSRKLLIAVATSALIALGQQLGLSDQTVQGIMAVISAFLIAQGWVDGKAAEAEAKVRIAEVGAKLHLDMSRLNAAKEPTMPNLDVNSLTESVWAEFQKKERDKARIEGWAPTAVPVKVSHSSDDSK